MAYPKDLNKIFENEINDFLKVLRTLIHENATVRVFYLTRMNSLMS